MFPFGETALRKRAVTVTDSYGNEVTDWSTPDELEIAGCAFEMSGTSEADTSQRAASSMAAKLYAPPGSDISPGDRILIHGLTFEVDGYPWSPVNPFTGWTPGMVVQLAITEG